MLNHNRVQVFFLYQFNSLDKEHNDDNRVELIEEGANGALVNAVQKRHGADSSDSDQGESVMAPPFETWHDTLDALVARLDECQGWRQTKKILKYLKETTGKRVILRVVHNLVHRLRAKRRGSGSIEARLKAVLRKFFANSDYPPSIFVDVSNKT
ncbi:hypothetical protein PC128_g21262 [Phytophthora cactorum]|nr:hypothetical protein PC128_g21262 [Phytophthora cactorum]